MKKFTFVIVFLTVMSFGFSSKASLADKLILYFPNRIVDMMDIFTFDLGFGPAIGARIQATRAMSFGAKIGVTADIIKEYNRQYGFGLENGWSASFMMLEAENIQREHCTRYVQEIDWHRTGVPSPAQRIYDFYEGPRDYWMIGGEVVAMVSVKAGIHPVEIFDFITGLAFIDIKGDDFDMEELSN